MSTIRRHERGPVAPKTGGAGSLTYGRFDPADEGLREALTSTGNGYLCMRGAAEWQDADDVHYPGTYLHGVYDREPTVLDELSVQNEDLVNLPNPLVLRLRLGDEEITLEHVELLAYHHRFDIDSAVVTRDLRFRDRAGRTTTLHSRRFVSMADPHLAAIEWTLMAEDWCGRVEVISAIDGRVTNGGVARYGRLSGRHLVPVAAATSDREIIGLKVKTSQADIYVGEAARTRVRDGNGPVEVARSSRQAEGFVQQTLGFDVRRGETVSVEKMIAVVSSRDRAVAETLESATRCVERSPDFDEALGRHESAWQELWRACDLRLPGNAHLGQRLRLNISHILQVCSPHTLGVDAGVPARGLNGEAYRGHVFWDELFVFPFLTARLPHVTRQLLMYRYSRLDEARRAAREASLRGAMFPWQSGSDGREESQTVHLNPLSGAWEPDLSRAQRHVNAAIFYNVWNYVQATRDVAFLSDYGAEIMLEIARFWASIAHFDEERQRYEIHGVMGPDEFHERYAGAKAPGLRNNAYTNVMVAWLCGVACEVLSLLSEPRAGALRRRLDLDDDELDTWRDMSSRMFVPFHGDGIISQFEGYENLVELDWDAYRAKYGNIQRLDRILRSEGDDPNRYRAAKQADVVMLFVLFSDATLQRLFARLGYDYASDTARKNIAYYDERTSHGSTLSCVAFAAALAGLDAKNSWERFMVALESDACDVQDGTTREGIHLGVMAGTLDLIQRAYAGCETRDDVLHFEPRAQDQLEGLSFAMQHRGTPLRVTLGAGTLTVAVPNEGPSRPFTIRVGDEACELEPGAERVFRLRQRPGFAGEPPS